jgi:hypothetical protein
MKDLFNENYKSLKKKFSKEMEQLVSKYMKNCSASLAIKET